MSGTDDNLNCRIMVAHKEIMVHLVTEDQREELQLVHKWKHKQTKEQEDEFEKMVNAKSKGLYEPFRQ